VALIAHRTEKTSLNGPRYKEIAAMKVVIFVVVALLAGVVALGFMQGWFKFGKDTDDGKPKFTFDAAKFKEDKETIKKKLGEKSEALHKKIASLKEKAKGKSGEDKTKADAEIDKLEKQHKTLKEKLGEVEEATAEKFEGLKKDLKEHLEDKEEDKPQ
jgi:hypothetical protein